MLMKQKLYWKNNSAIEIFKKMMYGKECYLIGYTETEFSESLFLNPDSESKTL